MIAAPESEDGISVAVSPDGEDGNGNGKSSGKFLVWLWLASIPLSFIGLIFTWASFNPLSASKEIMNNLGMLAPLLPSAISTVISKIVGIVAIWRRWRGDAWEDQSPLLQATGIFTVSFVSCWCLLVIGVFLDMVPVPQKFDFFLFEWTLSALFHMYFGLSASFVLFAYPILIPPVVLCILILRKKKLSTRAIRALTALSTLGWLGISFVGMVMSLA